MQKIKTVKKNKINIIPLIDIIFLMLVFFMLATNFNKDKQISFSSNMSKETIKKENSDSILVIKIKNDSYEVSDKNISLDEIEKNYLAQWDSVNFKKIVILNDNKSEFQFLITILDLIKKYKIENVNFSNEPK
ncbi:MAG: ExbD/TolR family protein [Alphaproteobacteria bacterium]|tara:strand:- start:590 stop:988 length:399 start_codon:yes stop_codon:yes gene_type:complete